ncbi:MAG: phosphate signaling complex protein PhoU [Oscillospiraceae bacterium]
MRSRFDEQLSILNTELIRMGALCEEAISLAAKAVTNGGDAGSRAIAVDSEIDRKERDIEGLCMRLLLLEHPVARDLRVVSSALKMISDMERIGDQAADIAEITCYIEGIDLPEALHIGDMARATVKMVTDSIDSFVKKDLEMAKAVMQYDDVVDNLFTKVKDGLTQLIRDGKFDAEAALDLLMIAKYFERIGDHACNIGEWVAYSITGIRVNNEVDEL